MSASTSYSAPSEVAAPQPGPRRFDDEPPARRTRRSRGGHRRPGLLTYTVLAIVALASIYPMWWTVVVSSRTTAALAETWPPLIPGGNFWHNASEVLTTIPFWLALANSAIIATTITVSVITFSTLAGYAFAKLRFRGSNALMVFVVVTLAIPTQLGIIPLFMLMRTWGWTGEIGAVIVPTLVTAFGVFFMRQYLSTALPDELIEAARVDGASMIKTFWHVALPAARPAMAVLGLLVFMMAWTDYLWPFIVLDSSNPTLQTALAQLQSARYVDYSVVLAGAVLGSIPLAVVFIAAGKQLISGIMDGALKG